MFRRHLACKEIVIQGQLAKKFLLGWTSTENITWGHTRTASSPQPDITRLMCQHFTFLAKCIKVVLHLPPGHLPPPFLWHLPPLFLWHLPPPTFVHLPPGQLPPLNFFLIFHLFKRFKMTNFSLEVVMDEVLDM